MRTLTLALVSIACLAAIRPANAQPDCKHTKQGSAAAQQKGGGSSLWPMDILHERITLDLTLGNSLSAECTVTATPREAGLTSIALHLLDLTVDSVTDDAGQLAFTRNGELLEIDPGAALALGDTVTFTVHYHGVPATDESGFGGMYLTGTYLYNLGVAFTSVPHSYGRAWFPCVDNFTERNTYEFIVRTDQGRNAWCNGELLSEQVDGNDLVRHWGMDNTMPAYLAAVSAAPYTALRDTFPSVSGSQVPVVLAAVPGDTANLRSSFINLPTAFSCFEDWFGAYRWNKVGYVLTPTGAMEHSTSIHFPRTVINGSVQYEDVMAHELGHEWFGNLITCERAEEMYINEGFAEYLSYLFLECVYGEARYKNTMRTNHRKMVHRAHLLDEGWWALADVPQEWTYGEHSYNKGAAVLHSMRHYLGDDNFRTGLSSFLDTYAFQPVNTAQLRDHLSQATGVDMDDFFADWILQPGYAAFEVDSFSTTGTPGAYETTVHVQQKMRGPAQYYNNVPVSVTCMDDNGTYWTAPGTSFVGGPVSSFIVQPPFTPKAILLNADEGLNLGITYDRDTLDQPSIATYTNADFRITVNSVPGPVPIHIEEYWVAADPATEEGFAYVVSPDRWWRIVGAIPPDASLSGRISYDGRQNLSSALDIGLMQDAAGVTFHEDSLVLLYRPDQRSAWRPFDDFTVNVISNATDKLGRVDFDGLVAGEYTLGWRKSAVGIQGTEAAAGNWRVSPNPASDQVLVERTDANGEAGKLQLLDMRGRIVRVANWNTPLTRIDLNGLDHGTYHLMFVPTHGTPRTVDRIVVVR
jgi:hypothetical protein